MVEIFPIKAQYMLKEKVTLRINSDERITKVSIAIFSLYKEILSLEINQAFNTKDITIDTSNFSSGGYGVEAVIKTKKKIDQVHTAFDICTNRNESLRYGFVSDFDKKDINNGAIDWLRKCHINIVQFYDWSYRHDHLTSDLNEYDDMMGKHIYKQAIVSKNKEASSYGMRTMAYGAVYAASKDFYNKHKDWGLYYPDLKPITFIDIFYIMNIERNSKWCEHLINEYALAIKKMGFTGIHMDTYGFPKKATSINKEKHLVYLDEEFPYLINSTKEKLNKINKNSLIIFNNVSNWPVYATANSKTDAVYIEVWDPCDKYHHIASIIENAKNTLKKNKPIILAAYSKPFRTQNMNLAMNSARLLMACIVSSGAYHLLIGENKAVLTQGYYSDYTKLDEKSAETIKSYYDFMIRYYKLFYDKSLRNVSMSHYAGDSIEYISKNRKLSVQAKANKIWMIIRENKKRKVIYLINLCGNNDDTWNVKKNNPIEQHNIKLEVQIDENIKNIYEASPDYDTQCMHKLDYIIKDTTKGKYVYFSIPRVKYWSVIDIEL